MTSILICNESLTTGGVSTYTLRLATALKSRGWRVTSLVSTVRGEHYGAMATLVDQVIDLSGERLCFGKAERVAAIANDLRPNIILLNHCSLAHYALPLLARRIKPVAVLHNNVALFYRTAARFPEHIFRWACPTNGLAKGCEQYFPKRNHSRIRTVHHGVETCPATPSRRTLEGQRAKVIFVGNLGENKGADLLPAIFQIVASALPSIGFVVLGRGELADWLQGEFAARGLKVSMKGHVGPRQVYGEMAESQVLILPSRVEGFGLVLIEAMQCGTVPVASKLEGVTTDVVEHGRTGLLVGRNDVRGYAEAIIRLLRDPVGWAQMSATAAAVARERFSLEAMGRRYEALFAEPDDRPPRRNLGPISWRAKSFREHFRNRWGKS